MDTQSNQKSAPKASQEPTPRGRRSLWALLILVIIIAIALAVALWWCLYRHDTTPAGGKDAPLAVAGPCTGGAANNLPAGFSWYENASLGFKFAYPTSWGTVSVATTPMGGVSGHYLLGSFSANTNVSFGGNATDYVVNPRDGIPTDNPGYLEATSKFYMVQIWKLRDPATGTNEDKTGLFPIDETSVLKNGCNTKALVTQYPLTEFFGYSYDLARFNLQPTNAYYGVNFVVKNPTAAARADLDKIIASFQLIP